MWRNFRLVLLLVMLAMLAGITFAQNLNTPIPLAQNQLIAFLGDSITQQNLYTRYVELQLNAQFPDLALRFVNVGWSGRHAAHLMDDAVLRRDLLRLQPDIVLILFGMNDGWYRNPPVPAAIAAYQTNMSSLVQRIQTALPKTQVVLISPTMCDPAVGNYLRGYNDTLGQMAQYVRELAILRGLPFIDVQKPMLQVDSTRKAADTSFTMVPDGVHPNPMGHWLIATLISEAFGLEPGLQIHAEIDAQQLAPTAQAHVSINDVRMEDGALAFTITLPRVPVSLPLDARGALAMVPVQAAHDQAILTISNLQPSALYGVYANGRLLGRFTGAELAAGVEWTNPRDEDPLTDRVLQLAMQKFQYRWTAWRAPGTGLAEISSTQAASESWKALDDSLNRLTREADAEEYRTIAAAKTIHWRITQEIPVACEKWEVTGPMNYHGFDAEYPPEIGVDAGDWTVAPLTNNLLDFTSYFQQYRNSVLFARARIFMPHEATLSLSVGSFGSIKAWVNGTLCISRDTFRTAQPGQDHGTARLQPGWNTILLRENRGNQGWGIYVQTYLSGLTVDECRLVRTSPE